MRRHAEYIKIYFEEAIKLINYDWVVEMTQFHDLGRLNWVRNYVIMHTYMYWDISVRLSDVMIISEYDWWLIVLNIYLFIYLLIC
jgi:hypothetical protein